LARPSPAEASCRHLEGGPGQEVATGKYRAIQWAFERERSRLDREVVEDPDDPTFRNVGNEAEAQTANVKLNKDVKEKAEDEDGESFRLTAEEAEVFRRLKRQDGGGGNDGESFRLTEEEVEVLLRRKRQQGGGGDSQGEGDTYGKFRVNEDD
jgi:hypothetical protein